MAAIATASKRFSGYVIGVKAMSHCATKNTITAISRRIRMFIVSFVEISYLYSIPLSV